MPKPLKVKLFMNASASAVEEQLNTWLGELGRTAIIKTETTVAAVGERLCIVVTVWYEPQD
jgi:hypothetical protein